MVSTTAPDPAYVETMTMTHPSGATGVFKFRPLYQGTNNTPGECKAFGSLENLWFGVSGIPDAYPARSVFSKAISGAGITSRNWTYMYYPTFSFAKNSGSGSATQRRRRVKKAEGILHV